MHAFFDLLFCLGYILICAYVFNNSMLCRERALKTTVCSHSFSPEDYPWRWWRHRTFLLYNLYSGVQKSETILNAWNCYAHNRICNKKRSCNKKMQNRHISLMISDFWAPLKDAGSLFLWNSHGNLKTTLEPDTILFI